jgi:tetratricopeptide (TPR) repeat protein
MKDKHNKIIQDLKELLNTYLTESFAKDFMKVLDEDLSLIAEPKSKISELDKSQIEYELPQGFNYRIPIDKVLTLCRKLISEENYFNLMLDLSQLMLFAGEVSYSLEIAENLLSRLHSSGKYDGIKAEANLMISKIYWSQAYWDDCNYFITEAMKIFNSIESEAGIAKCENMLGTLHGEKGEFDEAQEHLEKALTHLNGKDDISTRAMIQTNLGVINTIRGNFEKAVWNYKNASERFEELKDNRRLARVYHNLGMLFCQMEKYDDALDEFNKCITISKEMDYLSNCAVSYIGKAYIYTKQNNSALAEAYTDKAMEIAYKINDTLSIADIYKIKGMIQGNLENFELSEEMFENSIRLNKDLESKLNEAESSVELGKLLEKTERITEAKSYLEFANEFFKNLNGRTITAGLVKQSS